MILQALNDYYERKVAEDSTALAPFGFETKELRFIVEIDKNGQLIQVEDTRSGEGSDNVSKSFLVPKKLRSSSDITPNFLWDNVEYVLGVPKIPRPGQKKPDPKRVLKQHSSFIQKISSLPESIVDVPAVKAVLAFLNNLSQEQLSFLPIWEDLQKNPNISFRIQGESELVCQKQTISKWFLESLRSSKENGICLVTGDPDEILNKHSKINGIYDPGGQAEKSLVSFNKDAFTSYQKKQNHNSPIGANAAFAYTTALNYLLRKKSQQRIQVGDTSTVFWADKPTELETQIVDIFGDPPKDDPDRNTNVVMAFFKAVNFGRYADDQEQTRFYVLGLAPNAARISIRFWEIATVTEMAERIYRHFCDLKIVRNEKRYPFEYLPLYRSGEQSDALLNSLVLEGKAKNIQPNLAGEVMRSILTGQPYPQALLTSAVHRTRAERNVTYPRAALIKAYLNRAARYGNKDTEEELKMSLDETNTNVGYRLGRLFAVLEKIQEDSARPAKINATIRDTSYGAASATPVSIFSRLIRLSSNHLTKLKKGEYKGIAVTRDKQMQEVMEGISDFPANLSLLDQGRFAIGYYHQRQDFFKKREVTENSNKGDQQ